MADRCVGCGGWLQPDLDVCPTCQRPVKAAEAGGSPLEQAPELALGGLATPPPPSDRTGASSGLLAPIEPLIEAPASRREAEPKKKGSREISEGEVKRLAKYPDPPANPVAAIAYAISVFQRRQELARERENIAARTRQANVRAEEAFATLGEAVMASRAVLDLEAVTSKIAAVEAARGEADERGQEFETAQAEAEAERANLDAQIEAAEAELGPHRDRETRLEKELEMARHELARANAKAQRADIQLRNAGQDPSAGVAMDALRSEKEARDAEVRLAEERVSALTEELTEVRREMAGRVAALADLKGSRSTIQKGIDSTTGIYRESAGAASDVLKDALGALGREASERDLVSELGEPAQLAKRAASERDARTRELEMHNRALEAYDKKGFNTGAGLVSAAGLFILVALVVMIVR